MSVLHQTVTHSVRLLSEMKSVFSLECLYSTIIFLVTQVQKHQQLCVIQHLSPQLLTLLHLFPNPKPVILRVRNKPPVKGAQETSSWPFNFTWVYSWPYCPVEMFVILLEYHLL